MPLILQCRQRGFAVPVLQQTLRNQTQSATFLVQIVSKLRSVLFDFAVKHTWAIESFCRAKNFSWQQHMLSKYRASRSKRVGR
eukprot:3336169-Rhodomonas_salina.2